MFSEAKARRVTQFIECLRHTKGEFHGQPFKLLPWQEKIIRDVFGTVRDEDPTMRQYNTAHQSFREAVRLKPENNEYRRGALDAALAMKRHQKWPYRVAEWADGLLHRRGRT